MKKFTFSKIIVLILIVNQVLLANLYKVPSEVETIQNAINLAVDGDTVLVAPGRYYENINFNGRNILVTSNFMMSKDKSDIYNTIIDGSSPNHPDTASCVLIINGETSDAILQGFMVTGGEGTKWLDEHGAGTYTEGGGILTAYTSPTIRYNVVSGNKAIKAGGDIVSGGGGGIRCGDGSPLIVNNIIENNEGLYGGGIVLNYATGIIKNNIIKNNRVVIRGITPTFGGGGIWVNARGPNTIENNTIINNSSAGFGTEPAGMGGGVVLWGTKAYVFNNIIWGNSQPAGSQIYKGATAAEIEYNNVEDGFDGEGNMSVDPEFVDDSYFLKNNSPCIDAGNPDENYNDPEDETSPGNAFWPAKGIIRNDIGAYGGPNCSALGDVPTSLGLSTSSTPASYYVSQNYPNPFNPSTVIEYSIPAISELVSLKIYDVLGKEVATLVNESQRAGLYEVNWDGSDFSTGVYIYELRAGNYLDSKKMVLIR